MALSAVAIALGHGVLSVHSSHRHNPLCRKFLLRRSPDRHFHFAVYGGVPL